MSAKKKTAAVAALLLAAALGTWSALETARSSAPTRSDAASRATAPTSDAAAPSAALAPAETVEGVSGPRLAGRVVDETGIPIPGARVVACPSTPLGAVVRTGEVEPPAVEVLSGQGGRFDVPIAVQGVPWAIYAAKAGHGHARIDGLEPRTDLTIILDAPDRLRGRVTDHKGNPIPGANVRWSGSFYGLALEAETVSGADGTYDLEVAPIKGGFLVQVGAGGAAVEASARGYAPLFQPLDQWNQYTRTPLEQDLVLLPGQTVRGRVVDAVDGRPLPDARVVAWHQRTHPYSQFQFGARHVAEARTGANGEFLLDDVFTTELGALRGETWFGAAAPGHVRHAVGRPADGDDLEIRLPPSTLIEGRVLHADGRPAAGITVKATEADGRVPQWPHLYDETRPPDVVSDQGGSYALAVGVGALRVIADTTSTEVEALLDKTARVPDLVLPEPEQHRIQVHVTDESGRPVEGAFVYLLPRPGLGRTDADGWARFTPKPQPEEGTVLVAVAGGHGFAHAVSDRFVYTLEPTTLSLELRRGHTLEGQVIWPDGTPVERAQVVVYNGAIPLDDTRGRAPTAAEDRLQQVVVYGRAQTDASGRFRVAGLLPGPYHVTATFSQPGAEPLSTSASDVATGAEVLLTVPEARPTATASIELALADPDGDAPPARFLPWAVRSEQRRPARIIGLGRCRWDLLADGLWTLQVSAPGYVSWERSVHVAAGENVRITADLSRGALVSGRITAPENTSLKGARLAFGAESAGQDAAEMVRADGTYERSGLGAGRYHPCVYLPDGRILATRDALVVEDGAREIRFDIEATPAGTLRLAPPPGEISAATTAGLSLNVTDADGRLVRTRTGASALAAVLNLPAGRYVLRLESAGGRRREWTVDVEAGKTASVRTEMR